MRENERISTQVIELLWRIFMCLKTCLEEIFKKTITLPQSQIYYTWCWSDAGQEAAHTMQLDKNKGGVGKPSCLKDNTHGPRMMCIKTLVGGHWDMQLSHFAASTHFNYSHEAHIISLDGHTLEMCL